MHRCRLFCHNQGSRWIHTSNKTLTLLWQRSLSYSNQFGLRTGFYMIGTSVMKELRRPLSIILQKSFLTWYNAEFAFFKFFFLSGFFFTNIQDWQGSWGRRRLCLCILSVKSHLLYRHLNISRLIAAGRQPLATGLEPGTFGFLTQVGNH